MSSDPLDGSPNPDQIPLQDFSDLSNTSPSPGSSPSRSRAGTRTSRGFFQGRKSLSPNSKRHQRNSSRVASPGDGYERVPEMAETPAPNLEGRPQPSNRSLA